MSLGVHGFKRSAKGMTSHRKSVPLLVLALCMTAGAALYFSSAQRPGYILVATAWTAGVVALGLMASTGRAGRSVSLGLIGLVAGFLVADHRVSSIHARQPAALETGRVEITGWLERVERSSSGRSRLVIRPDGPEHTGRHWYRVRVLANANEVRPGDRLSLVAMLDRPRPAVLPGGYDSRYYAFFQRVQASGYALAAPHRLAEQGPLTGARRLARWRYDIAEAIRARMDGPAAGIAAALLVGDRSGIEADTAETLRVAGLGHILAISGLHMALMAGGSFFAIRLLLAAWSGLARRTDVARLAACIALLVSSVYLLMSGAGIPTQRAFVVTAVALGAVIAGRRAFSFQSFALALAVVVVLQPESVVSPGFQMSFSAVGALIAVHDWRRRRALTQQRRVPGVLRPFLELGLTSFVAGTATAVIGAVHFHRLASYGLAGNLLAMPVFSFLVMPAGVLGLLLMPLGVEGPAFAVMQWGLDVILGISAWIETLPTAARGVPAAPSWWLALYAVLVITLFAAGHRLVQWGAVVCLAGLVAMWALWPQPSLLVSANGLVVARQDDGWVANTTRRGRFPRQVFLQTVALEGTEGEVADCDTQGCVLELETLRVAVPDRIDALNEDCRRADIVVMPAQTPRWIAHRCAASHIALAELAERGNALVWLSAGEIIRVRYVDAEGANWPWQTRQ